MSLSLSIKQTNTVIRHRQKSLATNVILRWSEKLEMYEVFSEHYKCSTKEKILAEI